MKTLSLPKGLVLNFKVSNFMCVKSGARFNKVIFKLLTLSMFLIFLMFSNLSRAEPISLQLNLSAIDFGDVYTDSEVDYVVVDFTIKADNNRNYTIEISNDDNSNILELSRTAGGNYKSGSITYTETGTGNNQLHEFYAVPKTANIGSDLSASITVQVAYTDSE
jgi:hypothetical protein